MEMLGNKVAGFRVQDDISAEEGEAHPLLATTADFERYGLMKRRPETEVMQVVFIGPKCTDVKPGDFVLLPPTGGLQVTLIDPVSNEAKQYLAIEEDNIYAIVYREEANAGQQTS